MMKPPLSLQTVSLQSLMTLVLASLLMLGCAQHGGSKREPLVIETQAEQIAVNYCEKLLTQFNTRDYQSLLDGIDKQPLIRKLQLQLGNNSRYTEQLPHLEKRVDYVIKQFGQTLSKFKAKRWYPIESPRDQAGKTCLIHSSLVENAMSIIKIRYRALRSGPAQVVEVEELNSNISLYSRALTFINILTLAPEHQNSFSAYLANIDKKSVRQRIEEFRRLPVEFKHQAVALVPLFRLVDDKNAQYFQPLVEEYLAAQSDSKKSFFLQAYWLATNQYDKAKNQIDSLYELLGPSAPIDLYYASLEFDLGERRQAYRHYSDLIERNIDFEDGYWAMLGALMEDKRHEETVLALKALESYFGYSFEGVEFNEPRMKQFSESSAYKNWVSAR